MFTLQKCEQILAEVLIPRTDKELHGLLGKAERGLLVYDCPCNCFVATLFGRQAAIDAVGGGTWLSDVNKAYFELGSIGCSYFRDQDSLRKRRIIPLINVEFERRFAARYESEAIVREWADNVRRSQIALAGLIDRKRAEEEETVNV